MGQEGQFREKARKANNKISLFGEALSSTQRLDSWIQRNGWAGYDPYDIKGHKLYIHLINGNTLFKKTLGLSMNVIEYFFPLLMRKAFRIRKNINPMAMGLFASAYLDLYKVIGEEKYLNKAEETLAWLEKNPSPIYAGFCWGCPFDWQSLVLIPKETPCVVVSSICGDAFWDFYRFTGNKRYLDICHSICRFFLTDLYIDHADHDKICFSYSPVDRFHIHNANLIAAEFLIRVSKEINDEELCKHGFKALNYSLAAQNRDGSFYYWALSDKRTYNISDPTLKYIDHYHTGFILRSLHSIYESTEDKKVFEALSRGYQFYRDNLFQDKHVPKLTPESKYPINIHCCSEAILCMSILSNLFPDALIYAKNSFLWTKENMQDRDGNFYYLKTKAIMSKIAYIRWGQAWMLRALAKLLSKLTEESCIK